MEQVTIRSYKARDYQGVRDVCCATGLLGEPVGKVFSDEETFANLFTKYYTDVAPESAFVIENQGKIVGYVLGCLDNRKFRNYFLVKLLPQIIPKIIWRYFTKYSLQERKWVRRVALDGIKGSLNSPPRPAHLHIDLLKEYRGRKVGKILINKFFQYMRDKGVDKIYGGVWSFDHKKTKHLYRKLGFQICAYQPSNIFKDILKKKVYALELMRDLTQEEWKIK